MCLSYFELFTGFIELEMELFCFESLLPQNNGNPYGKITHIAQVMCLNHESHYGLRG